MIFYCNAVDCKHNIDGECERYIVSLDDWGECTDYDANAQIMMKWCWVNTRGNNEKCKSGIISHESLVLQLRM